MVSNIGNAKKFLMYPRFLQDILDIETRIKRQYKVLKFSSKLFTNMRFNFEAHPMPLLTDMLSQDQEEHEPLGGSFHMSPPRSTQAPPSGQTSSDTKDLITLTALSSVVSTFVNKLNTLETELKDHMKLFKDVVGKLVKKVKAIEVKLRTSKRKMVVSDSDQEKGGKQDVDLDALLALANAVVTVDSNISLGGASYNPTASTSVPADVHTIANVPTGSTSVPADVPTSVSNKGKTLMVEEDIIVKERTFKQMQEVEANAYLSKTLLGDDVSEDNFPARMDALIKRTLKRTCTVLEEPSSKRQKSTEAPIPSEVIPTPLGDINALYRIYRSTVYFITLREILHMVDRQDLLTLYGLVVKYYANHLVAGAGLILWVIFRCCLILKKEVVYMFADVPYPLSVQFIKMMLTHKLEIDKDVVGNDMTTVEQLIQFIKNQLVTAQVSSA
uniref:Aminoacyl-tRNA synthetase, class 1a, anticodon-binding n=1 Tax=Tanacetum cinerariifolium TaxID=118510 RepID=A0A699I7X4_TANCI|nr:aminoacyl-tRNA synthetase, class 1a, anticodon-binding [Tanacetum cinerariifolium]